MKKFPWKPVTVTILAVLVVEILLIVGGVYSGIPDVAATNREGRIMRWFFSRTKDHSIEARAEKISAPSLEDSSMAANGFEHYHEMCVSCHGAPGHSADEFAKGLNPHAPNLARSTRDMSPSEMFLVVKDGIKMTGMPAFGPTHSDSAVWDIVAFLKRMQSMTPKEYAGFQKNLKEEGDNKRTEHRH